jgi:hypothetical protein
MNAFFWWLRTNSQKYLLEATQKDLARRYGRSGPVGKRTPQVLFWKYVFAPLYRRLPWSVKHTIIVTMPGSHRKQWNLPPS